MIFDSGAKISRIAADAYLSANTLTDAFSLI
ncbi:unannotated protein [freshwater metagenome]|uniref:Unannotated protein n=1 Tax=freshwater metagenome TaxID=449393 RepID=A0A6J7EWT4_9ZZZZ